MRRLLCVGLCILLLSVAGGGIAGGAGSCAFPYQTTDATGTDVTIPADPDRIVTLTPSAAQTMWEIDAFDEVVGTSMYASYLPGAEEKQVISAEADQAMVEQIVDLEPTLVLVPNASHDPAVVGQLRGLSIPTIVFAEQSTLEEITEQTERIGRLTGNCAAGELRAAQLRATIAAMEGATEDLERPRALNSFYGYSSGAETFTDDIMHTAGVSNVAAARFTGWQQLSEEVVVTDDPEWLIAPADSPIPDTPAYQSTTAARAGQVIYLDTNELQQPAPRAVNATWAVLAAVHPAVHQELLASGPWYPIAEPPRFEASSFERHDEGVTVTVRPRAQVAAVRVTPSWGAQVTSTRPDANGSHVLEIPSDTAASGGQLQIELQGPDGLTSVRVMSMEDAPDEPPAEQSQDRMLLVAAIIPAIAAPLIWMLLRRR